MSKNKSNVATRRLEGFDAENPTYILEESVDGGVVQNLHMEAAGRASKGLTLPNFLEETGYSLPGSENDITQNPNSDWEYLLVHLNKGFELNRVFSLFVFAVDINIVKGEWKKSEEKNSFFAIKTKALVRIISFLAVKAQAWVLLLI